MKLGVEALFEHHAHLIAGKKLGLVSNYTMTNSGLVPVIDLFMEATNCDVTKLFGPEHGVRNSAREGEHVSFAVDRHSGLPAYSLYGDTRKPTADMLAELDALVIDLQDIGTRYYTNMNTAALCLEACSAVGMPCIVLDRPNPIGAAREGFVIRKEFASFVGMYPIVNRHGLTMGELTLLYNTVNGIGCDLTVVQMEGWKHSMFLADTGLTFAPPSPNTSGFDMMTLYPGTCLFEGTNVSVGRGTTRPFELIGAPWIDGHTLAQQFNRLNLPGVVARPVYFTPHHSLYRGELCEGVQLHITDPAQVHAFRAGVALVQEVAAAYPVAFEFVTPDSGGRLFFDLLAGDDRLRTLISQGMGHRYFQEEPRALAEFSALAGRFELYGR